MLDDTGAATRLAEGGKARGLRRLDDLGFAVPPWTVVRPHADPRAVLTGVVDPSRRYAVRSSSVAEDGETVSLAGRFTTALDVPGELDEVVRAVEGVRASAVVAGHDGAGIAPMAVVVQEMVDVRLAGVAFSRNPTTGLDEVVIETSASPTGVVDGHEEPSRWVFRWGRFTARPADGDADLVEHVARETARLADLLGRPIDAEWSWDGHRLWWLQARPLTGLDRLTVHSRRIAREVMPGIISPLTWSVNVPVVNGAWIRLLDRAVGPTGFEPHQLARRFGGRAYFDMTALGAVFEQVGMPRDSLEQLLGLEDGPERPPMRPGTGASLRLLPRLVGFAMSTFAGLRTVDRRLAGLEQEAAAASDRDVADDVLADRIEGAMARASRAAEANIVVPLLANARTGRARRLLVAAGADPDVVDLTAGVPGAVDHDPVRALGPVVAAVDACTAAQLDALGDDLATWPDHLRAATERFLARFGSLSDRTTDLTAVTWRERPTAVLALARAGGDVARATRPLAEVLTTPGRRLRRAVRAAGRAQVARESVSQAYTRIYMALRPLLFEAAERMVDRGALPSRDDVVHLEVDEVLGWLRGRPFDDDWRRRRDEMAAAEEYRVPDIVIGDDFVPVRTDRVTSEITGVGSSAGMHRGPVVVVRSVAEAPTLGPGDVLVVPHSDVSWTPLFRHASAVVAESGGVLSHSSIVAREFGIPCVVSAAGACDIPPGSEVVVDGLAGTVSIVRRGSVS